MVAKGPVRLGGLAQLSEEVAFSAKPWISNEDAEPKVLCH